MCIRKFSALLLFTSLALPAFAQNVTQQINCEDPENAGSDECLALPSVAGDPTNLVPFLAPAAGAAAVIALAGSGGTTSTTSTTSP